jgi:hypothetical protein
LNREVIETITEVKEDYQAIVQRNLKAAIEDLGVKEVIDAVGMDHIIDAVGLDYVIDAFGIDTMKAALVRAEKRQKKAKKQKIAAKT